MNEFTNILDNIKRYVHLNDKDEQQFINIVHTKIVDKKELLIKPNLICKAQTYVVNGVLRSYFVNEKGEEYTIQFAVNDWFISDFNSYINQEPATLYVEVLEKATIQQIYYEDVETLCLQNSKFERFFRLVAQKAFAFSQKRVLSNLGKTATQRFVEFNELYPNIVQKVPQYMIASYLGCTPEFLSKIRKRISLKS